MNKRKFIFLIFVIIAIVTIYVLKNYTIYNVENDFEKIVINIEEAQETDIIEINECYYKEFDPIYNNSYDYFGEMLEKMVYMNNIYYVKINSYEQYLEYTDKWNSIIEMTEEDFNSYYCIISAVENTSMDNLIVKNINYIESEDTLAITLIEDDVTETYNCISYKIPRKYDGKNTIITTENNSALENSTFKNIPIDDLNPISKEEATELWENYRKNMLLIDASDYKVENVEIEYVIPNNYFDVENTEEIEYANFTRKAYVFYCNMNCGLEIIVGYVDEYTGEILGGYYSGV